MQLLPTLHKQKQFAPHLAANANAAALHLPPQATGTAVE